MYEAKVLPIGAGFGILSWLSCPVVIWTVYGPWAAGTLDTVSYLLICMLPLFCAKLANSIFVDLTSYKNLMISKNKIMAVMKEPEETGSMEPLRAASHEIVFDHVDFSYVPGEPVLKQASFTVPDQKLTAIVGDSGSGKSTILNLIAKYYEVSGGTISIGGRPINHVAAERVLDQISMVDQDVFLFDDTVRENIRHARPDATDAEIEVACREANCDGFIRKMERGYDTPIGENGNLLSGGERQRLSIARAILKNSPILLLDEATASLDIENELAVKQAIANLLKEKKNRGDDRTYPIHRKKCRSDSGGFRWSDHRSWYTRRIVSKGWKVRCHVERRTAAFRLKGGYDEDSCVRGGLSGGCADTPKEARHGSFC